MIVEKMLDATKELWESYYKHPFVRGISDGSLSDERFKHYLIQDTLYLKEYARVFLIGAAKADEVDVMKHLSASGIGMIAYDDDLNKRNLARMGVSKEEIYQSSISIDNLSYVSYMKQVAYEGGTAEILAAVLPCGLSYEYLAKRMVSDNPACVDNKKHGDFISNYLSDSFCKYNAKNVELIELLSKDYSNEHLDKLIEIFSRCAEYELKFWDLSWNLE